MKFIIDALMIFLLLFQAPIALGLNVPPTVSENQYIKKNFIQKSPGAENGRRNAWAAYADAAGTSPVDGTGGSPNSTFTIATSSPLDDGANFQWDKGAANRQGEGFSVPFTIDNSQKNKSIWIHFNYSILSGTYATGDMTLWVYDVTNATLLGQLDNYQLALPKTTNLNATHEARFVASTSTSYRLIFHTSSTSTSSYSILFDNVWAEQSFNSVGHVGQSQFVGQAYFATTTNCTWQRSNTAMGAFGTDADCPGPTIESQKIGSWQTTDADLPQITINNLPPGLYRVIANATTGPTGGDVSVQYAISDGTTTTGRSSGPTVVNTAGEATPEGFFEYATAGNRTFAIHSSASANTANLYNDVGNRRLVFTVYRFPLESQLAYATDQSDYGPIAYTPTGSWSSNTTYTGFQSRTNGMLSLDLKVAVTGAPTSANLTINLPTNLTIDTTKLTDVTAGVASVGDCTATIRDSGTDVFQGHVVYNSTTSIAILKDDGDGTLSAVTQAAPMTWDNGDFVTIKCKDIPIANWSVTNRAQQLINTVVSTYTGVINIVSAKISSTGTVSQEYGDWINGNCAMSGGSSHIGTCTLNTDVFTASPNCFMSPSDGTGAGGAAQFETLTTSTTSVSYTGVDDASGAANPGYLICMGPK